MSFQTSQIDTNFDILGERILSSSTKGQIFEFQDIIYVLYTEYNSQKYSIIIYETLSQQKSVLYTSESKIVIRTLRVDHDNRKVWFGGYIESPMRAFFTFSTISPSNTFSTISLTIREDMKTIESIAISNNTTILLAGSSQKNECWIVTNISSNIYKIDTSLNSTTVKDIYLRDRFYYIFIEGISKPLNKNTIEMYKIHSNTLNGSL